MDLISKDAPSPSLRGIKVKKTAGNEREGAWLILLFIIFAAVLIIIIGLALYRSSVKDQIKSAIQELQTLNEQNGTGRAKEIIALEEKIINVKYLFDNHLYPSIILKLLEENTLKVVTWTKFNFDANKSTLILEGSAPDWSDVAGQIVAFEAKDMKVANISRLAVDKELGVTFSLSINYKPALIKL